MSEKKLVSFEPDIELSDKEKEKIDSTIIKINEAISGIGEEIKDLPRDEAMRRMKILVNEINWIPGKFTGAKRETEKIDPYEPDDRSKRVILPSREHVSADKPDLMKIVSQLSTNRKGPKDTVYNDQKRALEYLDCVKNYEELGDDVVCPECNPEIMLRCINTADPTIRVEPGAVSRQQ